MSSLDGTGTGCNWKKGTNSKIKGIKQEDAESDGNSGNDYRAEDAHSQQKIDVYEFKDNDDTELFKFRPWKSMERFKRNNSTYVNELSQTTTFTIPKFSTEAEEDSTVSSSVSSDGDDFVYMSDDYMYSNDINVRYNTMACETGNNEDTKDKMKKRNYIVEQNADTGKVINNDDGKKSNDTDEPKTNLDLLFNKLMEEHSRRGDVEAAPKTCDKKKPEKDVIPMTIHTYVNELNQIATFTIPKNIFATEAEEDSTVSSSVSSDGDDFVYMSDDNMYSNDINVRYNTMACETGNNEDTKDKMKKRNYIVEQNADTGKVINNDDGKKSNDTDEPKPKLDLLFNKLMEEHSRRGDVEAAPKTCDKKKPEKDVIPMTIHTYVNELNQIATFTIPKNIFATEAEEDSTVSSSVSSDGDDFVYMSDDYMYSNDINVRYNTMACETGNNEGTKDRMKKRNDIVEQNADTGKVFNNHDGKKSNDTDEPKTKLDLLFNKLMEEHSRRGDVEAAPKACDKKTPEKDVIPMTLHTYVNELNQTATFTIPKNIFATEAEEDSTVSSRVSSDEDDFVYMSDDYMYSNDINVRYNTMACEKGNNEDTKDRMKKRNDIVEQNADTGKVFNNDDGKKSNDTDEPKTKLDMLYNKLMEEHSRRSDVEAAPKSCDKKTPKKYVIPMNLTESPPKDVLPIASPKLFIDKDYGNLSPKISDLHKQESQENYFVSKYEITGMYEEVIMFSDKDNELGVMEPRHSKIFDLESDQSKITLATSEPIPSVTCKRLSTEYDNADSAYDTKAFKAMFNSFDFERDDSDNSSDTVNSSGNGKEDTNISLDSRDYILEQTSSSGVAIQRDGFKYTVGKQNLLAEMLNSETEPDDAPPRLWSTESVVFSTGRKKKDRPKAPGNGVPFKRMRVADDNPSDVPTFIATDTWDRTWSRDWVIGSSDRKMFKRNHDDTQHSDDDNL